MNGLLMIGIAIIVLGGISYLFPIGFGAMLIESLLG